MGQQGDRKKWATGNSCSGGMCCNRKTSHAVSSMFSSRSVFDTETNAGAVCSSPAVMSSPGVHLCTRSTTLSISSARKSSSDSDSMMIEVCQGSHTLHRIGCCTRMQGLAALSFLPTCSRVTCWLRGRRSQGSWSQQWWCPAACWAVQPTSAAPRLALSSELQRPASSSPLALMSLRSCW